MKIRFNKTLDDFAAFQTYHAKHSKHKAPTSLVIFAGLLLLLVLCIIGENIYHKQFDMIAAIILAVVICFFVIVRNKTSTPTTYYKQGQYLEKEGVQEITGESTMYFDNEQFYCESMDTVVKKSLDGIEKIVICQDYLFIYINPITAHYVPRGGIIEGDFDAFAAGLIEAYQAHAAAQGAESHVVQGELCFQGENIQKGLSYEGKLNKAQQVLIWAVIFGIPSGILASLIFGVIMQLLLQQGVIVKGEPLPAYPLFIVFGIPIVTGLIGGFLSFKEKLPIIKGPFGSE